MNILNFYLFNYLGVNDSVWADSERKEERIPH